MSEERSEIYEVITKDGEWYELRKRELHVRRTPNWEEFDVSGFVLGRMSGSIPFWIGDYVERGEELFSEKFSQALIHFGDRNYQTIANYASVCRRVPARYRNKPHRRDELSFSHHDAVAALTHAKQSYWLQRAVDEEISSKDLRALVNPKTEGDTKSVYEALDDFILGLIELKTISPAELRIHIDEAIEALRTGRAEISKIHSRAKIEA